MIRLLKMPLHLFGAPECLVYVVAGSNDLSRFVVDASIWGQIMCSVRKFYLGRNISISGISTYVQSEAGVKRVYT